MKLENIDINNLPISQKVFFKGDMANLEGYGRITKRYDHREFGISYAVLLDDGREFNRVEPKGFLSEYRWVLINRDSDIQDLENLYFENRSWKKAKYPRLHMKNPETFKHTETQNFTPIDKEIHLEIGFHIGKNSWHLTIYTHQGINCSGKTKFFSSIEDIKTYIQKTYNKNPILPEFTKGGE